MRSVRIAMGKGNSTRVGFKYKRHQDFLLCVWKSHVERDGTDEDDQERMLTLPIDMVNSYVQARGDV